MPKDKNMISPAFHVKPLLTLFSIWVYLRFPGILIHRHWRTKMASVT